MSINVTVSGSPVRIKRGKMVTSYDPSKNEFERRRLMRLEQVRQQSRDIAENIRNKTRKEKSKQLSEIEKEGESKLKNWQARKLLELQNQYQEALDEIGLAHKQATGEEAEDDVLIEQQESYDKIAKERGRAAAERLQIEKNEDNLRKAVPIQRKKITRDVENTRSGAVSNLHKVKQRKSPFKKKKKPQLSSFDSDSENRVPELFDLDEGANSFKSWNFSVLEEPPIVSRTNVHDVPKVSKEQQTSNNDFQVPTSDKAAQTLMQEEIIVGSAEVPMDTRISEHIKRRTILDPREDYCDFIEKELPVKNFIHKCVRCNCCNCPERSREPPKEATIPEDLSKPVVTDKSREESEVKVSGVEISTNPASSTNETSKIAPGKRADIPAKPKITLRPTKDRPVRFGTDSKNTTVQYYDHPNRFSKRYVPKSSHVEKIDDDNLVISPNALSEDEIREKMRQRDIEAHIRGQVALEKEKIQREYRELLKKLPALQKQERIGEIGMDKEKYHMSQDRLDELEKKRQNRMDNTYEKVFVRGKPAAVTLPSRKNEIPPSINLSRWNVDLDPPDSRLETDTLSRSRTEQLSHLLTNLKTQKDHLLKEIENTLSKDTLGGYDDLKSKSTDYSSKRKRGRDERAPSPSSSDLNFEEESESKTIKSSKNGASTVTAASSPSPRKKAKLKSKRRVLVLQNTSTQTTPKTGQSAATSPLLNTPVTDKSDPLKKDRLVCGCYKDPIDDLCEIVIKIKEDEKPEVIVNPPLLGKSVKVVTEERDKSQDVGKKIRKVSPRTKTSWREQLSGSSQSTTSTSYLDLPDLAKASKRSSQVGEISRSINSTASSKKLDPRLLIYIKKLLNMSRASIDDLAVSAASDVSTPTQSVVETPNNNPLLQLQNVIKYFNLDPVELKKQLGLLSEDGSVHYNTSDSVAVSSTSTSDGDKSVQFRSCVEIDSAKRSDETNRKLIEYADIAESCNQKISSLTAMIEKVRAEKKKMLRSPPTSSDSDKDPSTAYMSLPKQDSSSEQNELDNRLLGIDYSYAERLKHLTPEEIEIEKRRAHSDNRSDTELLLRLKKLLQEPKQDETAPKTKQGESPVLLDIPKLPKLEASSLEKKKTRPPPSKGLRALGANAQIVPHELSTIVEAESQLSTKIVPDIITEVPQEPRSQSTNNSSEVSEMETMETMLISIGMEWAIPTLKKTRQALAQTSSSSSGSKSSISSDVSLKQFLSKISSSSSTLKSESESQGISLIQAHDGRTSTPIQGNDNVLKAGQPIFLTDSDISSVREHSDENKFYDLNEGSSLKAAPPAGGAAAPDGENQEEGRKEEFYDLPEGSISKTG